MDVLDLEDIKLEKKEDNNNNELKTNESNININEEIEKIMMFMKQKIKI